MSSVLDTIGVSCIGHRGGMEAGEVWGVSSDYICWEFSLWVCVFSFL